MTIILYKFERVKRFKYLGAATTIDNHRKNKSQQADVCLAFTTSSNPRA